MPQIPKRCPTVANMGCSPPWLERGTPNGFEWEDVRRGLGVGAIGEIVYAALGPSVAARPRVESVLEGIAEFCAARIGTSSLSSLTGG